MTRSAISARRRPRDREHKAHWGARRLRAWLGRLNGRAGVASPALAQVDPPTFSSVDENGVDLTTGAYSHPGVSIAIGDPAAGWLTFASTCHAPKRAVRRRRSHLACPMCPRASSVWLQRVAERRVGRAVDDGMPPRPPSAFRTPWRAPSAEQKRQKSEPSCANPAHRPVYPIDFTT